MEGSTVPEFGLEYLLGSYCSSNDEVVIAEGLQTAKILAENYVRPDEAKKSSLRSANAAASR
jgi:ATP-dependent Lon protease